MEVVQATAAWFANAVHKRRPLQAVNRGPPALLKGAQQGDAIMYGTPSHGDYPRLWPCTRASGRHGGFPPQRRRRGVSRRGEKSIIIIKYFHKTLNFRIFNNTIHKVERIIKLLRYDEERF